MFNKYKEVKKVEEILRQITDKLDHIFWLRSADNKKIHYISSNYEKIWGKSRQSYYKNPDSFIDIIHEDDKKKVLKELDKEKKGGFFNLEYRIVNSRGEIRWVWARSFPVKDEKGDILNFCGIAVDITERKEIENKLIKSEEKFRSYIEKAPLGIFIIDNLGNFIEVNSEACIMTGYSEKELLKLNLSDTLILNDLKEGLEGFNEVKNKGLAQGEFEILKNNNETIIVKAIAVKIEANRYMVMFSDITKETQAKEEIEASRRKIDKLKTVGLLAGGIAHDFNNFLAVSMGNVSLAKSLLKTPNIDKNKIINLLEEAEKSFINSKQLTKQLLTFSKGGKPVLKNLSIREFLKESVEFVLRGSNIGSKFYIEEDVHNVLADAGQINQVINNIVINACHAMPTGGILKIIVKNIIIDKDSYRLNKGKYVKISIEDEGIGIPKEDLEKIFDPYYSTKGNGTCLGLATSYSIVKKHGGYISVDSKINVGTTFNIYLRATEKRLFSRELNQKNLLHKGNGKILVMDDQKSIRDVLTKILKKLGYDVFTAKDGSEAIELFKGSPCDFSFVILDLTVKGSKGGKETIKEIRKINSNVKAIVSSGYSDDKVLADYKDFGFQGVITKPFNIEDISKVLQELL